MHLVRQVVRRSNRLAQGAQDDPQCWDRAGCADLVVGQLVPHNRDDDDGSKQTEAEHRIASKQQNRRRATHMRNQQCARGRGDHRRDHRHQPTSKSAVSIHLVSSEGEERNQHRSEYAERGAHTPQHDVNNHSSVPKEGFAYRQRTSADSQESHSRSAIKVRHQGVKMMGAGDVAMLNPVQSCQHAQNDQPHARRQPHHHAKSTQRCVVGRKSSRGIRHDAGAHHAGKPVRSQVFFHSASMLHPRGEPR